MKGVTLDGAAIRMTEADDVATALEDLAAGREFDVDGRTVELQEAVEFGHKFALEPFEPGDRVRKYDEVIGEATEPIAVGEWVHTHNLRSIRARPDGEDSDSNDSQVETESATRVQESAGGGS